MKFINKATVGGEYMGTPVYASSNCVAVELTPPGIHVCERIPACCIRAILRCYVCYKGVKVVTVGDNLIISVGFEIYIKCIDCYGETRRITQPGSVNFVNPNLCLHRNLDLCRCRPRFHNISFEMQNGNVEVEFDVTLT